MTDNRTKSEIKIKNKKYYEHNKARESARHKIYVKKHYQKILEYNRNRYKPCSSTARSKKWRENHRKEDAQRTKDRRNERMNWYNDLRKTKRCEKCGIDDWIILIAHHINQSLKKFNIVSAIYGNIIALDEIKKEIDKCIFLCPNCHAVETREQYTHKKARSRNEKRRVEWYNEIRKTKRCEVCNDERHFILIAHHFDPKTKRLDISKSVRDVSIPLEEIENEIKKCIFLCPNCHAKETLRQREEGEISVDIRGNYSHFMNKKQEEENYEMINTKKANLF